MSGDADGIRVLRGCPSHEELAAVLAALLGAAQDQAPSPLPATADRAGATWGRTHRAPHRQTPSWKTEST